MAAATRIIAPRLQLRIAFHIPTPSGSESGHEGIKNGLLLGQTVGLAGYRSIERQEATARSANRRLPVNFKALIRRGSLICAIRKDFVFTFYATLSFDEIEGANPNI